MTTPPQTIRASRVQTGVKFFLQAIVAIGLSFELYEGHWLNAAVISGILLMTMLPTLLASRLKVLVPPEFELMAIIFTFAALFLGETRDYYDRFWWWDLALHTTSGGLLGILGVLLVYVLNETPRINVHMQPGFVAFFAFCFSVAGGAVWEIFEFTMDQVFGMNMQKPMLGDSSGLTDSMWDLIVDTVGALIVAVLGYLYMRGGRKSFIETWVQRFVDANPRLFTRKTG